MVGLLLLTVVWGPWIYTELARTPEQARGRSRHGFADSADEPPAEEQAPPPVAPTQPTEPTEPMDPAAQAPSEHAPAEPDPDKAVGAPLPTAPAADPTAIAAAEKPAEPAAAAEGEADEAPRPVWPHELAAAFRKTFDAEPRDGFWAESYEPKLRTLFRGAGADEHTVGEVVCRKTVCRVAFSMEDLDAEAEATLLADAQKLSPALALDEKHSEAHAALYVLRQGYQLER